MPKTINATPFTSEPIGCEGLTYTFNKLNDATNAEESLPGFITPSGSDLALSSNQQSDEGVYTIQLKGSVSGLPSQSITFKLTVYPGDCDNEILGPAGE